MPHIVIPVENISTTPEPVTCANCQACCCQLEVRIVTDTGVPFNYIEYDKWGSEVMKRADDGWCQQQRGLKAPLLFTYYKKLNFKIANILFKRV